VTVSRRAIVVALLGVVLLVAAFAGGWLSARTGMGTAVPITSLEARERAFVDDMRGAVLDGMFTVDGQRDPPTQDRYEIASVEKVGDNLWRFNVRMVHGTTDVTLPIVVPMQWVGDTPVVTLTDYSIPTLGTFTARVFFYDSRYAGTWQHGQEIGGHLYGKIARVQAP
jgi:hypothetical protein